MNSVAELLKKASSSLKKERPGMSVRAVAGRLNVSPSYWSKVLRGERPLTPQLLPRVVRVLSLDVQQIAELQRSILENIEQEQLSPATGIRIARAAKDSPVSGYKNLGESEFWILEQWFHIPVLNACTLAEKPDARVIAKKLGVDVLKVEDSIQKLISTGFLKVGSGGELERTNLQIRFPTSRSHPKIRQFHACMIEKAHREITQASAPENFEARLISGVSFAGSKEKIQEARLILEEAMYRAANLMSQDVDCEEIYQLNVQLFPLTK